MSEPLNFDHLLDEILLVIKKETKRISDFGEKFRDKAQVIYNSLPKGVYKNIYVSGEIADIANPLHSGVLIFTKPIYRFGEVDQFFESLSSTFDSIRTDTQLDQTQKVKDLLEQELGSLAKYDMSEIYDELKTRFENIISSQTNTLGRWQNFIDSKTIILGGNLESDLMGAFLVRISVSGFVGKLFIVPKAVVLEDESKAEAALLSAINNFISLGPEAINEAI